MAFKSIHIAGTNGKGSSAAYAGNIIRRAGYTCGVYTSPHVVSPTERITINGSAIPKEDLERLLKKYQNSATFFHAYTDAAFEWFEENKADYAVVETGLGGRLDPTNIIKPEIGILTSIGYDHADILGNDIKMIAKEKCGIIKPGMQIITCSQKDEVMREIEDACREKECGLIAVCDEDIQIHKQSISRQVFDLFLAGKILKQLEICMPGIHQPQNASLASAACLVLGMDEKAIRQGLCDTKVISRFEIIPGDPLMILDGAHNEDSAQELKDTLGTYYKGRDTVLLTAAMADKDIECMMHIFASFASAAFTVKADAGRGANPGMLAEILSRNGVHAVSMSDIGDAFNNAFALAKEKDALLVISGSFYLAGRIKQLLQERQNGYTAVH